MTVWLFLHILAMFIAFALTTGTGIYLAAIVASGDVRAIRVATRTIRPLAMGGTAVLIVGVLLGFAVAANLGLSMSATWLLVTYACVLLVILIGFLIHRTWADRLAAAAAASPVEQPSPELSAVMSEGMAKAAGPISGLLWIVILAMMVFRPQ